MALLSRLSLLPGYLWNKFFVESPEAVAQCFVTNSKISNDLTQLFSKSGVIVIFITLIPTFIWLYFLFSDDKKRKSVITFIFAGGIMTVIPLLLMQKLFASFPCTNFLEMIPEKIPSIAIATVVITFILAMLEEIFKQLFLRFIDEKYLLVQTVNDSVKFAMIAALGFSFMENVYPYFFRVIASGQYKDFMSMFLIRSLFTSAMHITVSGIFGYHYGVSKFAIDFREQSNWEGNKLYFAKFLNRYFGVAQSKAYKEQRIFYGLLIAMGIHGLFNSLVGFGLVAPALILVIISFSYLMLLLKRKAGNLILTNDISNGPSIMAKKDEDVITELAGMWFNEKRYVDVIHICERLLQHDPNNNVIKLFREKAIDQLEGNDPYKKALSTILSSNQGAADTSQISRWIELQKDKGRGVPENFQNTPEYRKFIEEERLKKEKADSFKLDLG
ncbi:MAG: PrsW family glutamic-type intramembrane protease [Candidatus Peregrinibacteria bacterium]|nr:PrsW family glutamic-type intramembrane protease [Candidatus Peregrinibacteria bacterium]